MSEKKNATGGIKDISMLYELAMAVGKSLDLKENTHLFLKTLMTRKEIEFADCWIKNEYLSDKEDKAYATLIYAQPETRIKDTIIPINHPVFELAKDKGFFSISSTDDNFSKIMTEKGIEKGSLTIFALKDLGILKLYWRKASFEEEELNQLKDVMLKFATSIQTCLLYERLTKEITELKQTDERLKLYQFMVESAQDAIFFKDLESRYLIANDVALKAFGLPRQEVIGKNDYELMPDEEEAKLNVADDQQVFKTGKIKEITKHMTDAGGKLRWFQAIKTPHYDATGKIVGLVGIARDITDRKMMEEKIRQTKGLEAFTHIASEFTHEVKNLLTVIKCGLYYLKTILPEKQKDAQNTILQLDKTTNRIINYTSDMVNFSKSPVLQLRQIEVNKVLEQTIKEMSQEILSNIEIFTDFEDDLPLIKADSGRLKQVLTNLIKNASESMIDVSHKKLKIRSKKEERFIKISISDTGKGIPKEDRKHIFDPFFTTKSKGTGLGLGICKRFIEAHKGKIKVVSKVGKGTTLILKLPL